MSQAIDYFFAKKRSEAQPRMLIFCKFLPHLQNSCCAYLYSIGFVTSCDCSYAQNVYKFHLCFLNSSYVSLFSTPNLRLVRVFLGIILILKLIRSRKGSQFQWVRRRTSTTTICYETITIIPERIGYGAAANACSKVRGLDY